MSQNPAIKRSLFRRHPFLMAIGLFTALALGAAGLFLATFDLNAYRQTLEKQLSAALHQPVHIGSADVAWRAGPVFNIATVRIGGEASETTGEIAHLFLQPRLLPLLIGQVVFDNMVVDRPIYRLRLAPSAPSGVERDSTALVTALLQTVQVRNLTVIEGHFTLDDRRNGAAPGPLDLSAVELRIRNLSPRRSCSFRFSARLAQPDGEAVLSADGNVNLDNSHDKWHFTPGRLHAQVQNLAPERWLAYLPVAGSMPIPTGRADLELSAEGSTTEGLDFEARLTGRDLHLNWPGHFHRPPALRQVAISGVWSSAAGLDRLDDLELRLNDLALKGRLSLQREAPQPWLEGNLSSLPLELAEIRQFLPEQLLQTHQALLEDALSQGRIELQQLRFAGPLDRFGKPAAGWPITEARLALSDARLQLPSAPALEKIAFSLTLKNDTLYLGEGKASLLDGPVRFAGSAELPSEKGQNITLSTAWNAPAAALIGTRSDEDKVGGDIPVRLSLSGTPGRLQGRVQAVLDDCAVALPGLFYKTAGSPGEIRMALQQQDENWAVRVGSLNLAPIDLRLSGHISTRAAYPLDLHLRMLPVDLADAARQVPLLAKFSPCGTLALEGSVTGTAIEPQVSGELSLRNGGLSLKGVRADLRDINGAIVIRNRQGVFNNIRGQLGQSAAIADGTVTLWPDASLELHVKADSLRADELIFPGSELIFHKLDGTLLVDRQGIRYQEVRADLTDTRQIFLQGKQLRTHPAQVDLDIRAEQASIDEILRLWPHKKPEELANQPAKPHPRVKIRATIARGTYGHLHFTEAQGTILAEQSLVTIEPLEFRTGGGASRGALLIDHRDRQQTTVTFKTTLEDIDTQHLYGDLLQQRGLVDGKLSGEVQVQGPASSEFLKQGSGHAQIHITDGVLRKFSFLSKVFSLLNISQIFTLHLPDMATEGMPFSSLEATIDLADGKLATEDLAVESNAMNLSLVGGYDLRQEQFDLLLGIKPFGTVDKIVSKIPLAGWILTGDNKALITAHFRITGSASAPKVEAVPITSVSDKVLGIFQRVLGLPGKMVSDVGKLFQEEEQKETEEKPQVAEERREAADSADQRPAEERQAP